MWKQVDAGGTTDKEVNIHRLSFATLFHQPMAMIYRSTMLKNVALITSMSGQMEMLGTHGLNLLSGTISRKTGGRLKGRPPAIFH